MRILELRAFVEARRLCLAPGATDDTLPEWANRLYAPVLEYQFDAGQRAAAERAAQG